MNLRSFLLPTACLAACAIVPNLTRAQGTAPHDSSLIIAAIHEEKDAYLALDATRMAATWAQSPSSLKLYFFDGKEARYVGNPAIEQHDRANLDRERALPFHERTRFTFSDLNATQQGDSAWVTCHVMWSGYNAGQPISGKQTRVYVLHWINGRWRIALMSIASLAEPDPDSPAVPSAMQLNLGN